MAGENKQSKYAIRISREDLTKENRDLELRLQQRTAELEKVSSELERFAYAASHDLKSPLVTIKGFLGLLNQDIQSGDEVQIARDIQHIAIATEQMNNSLDDLLDLTRASLITYKPQLFSLRQVSEEVKNRLWGLIAENDIEFEIAADLPEVFADKNRISEVMQNLLDNAIKFCRDEIAPRITVDAEIRGNRVQCRVKDNGIGIDPRYQDRVFGLFEQLNQSTAGTGVGLALVMRIIEIHGGEVWVESDGIGEGTSVCFTLAACNSENWGKTG